MPSAHSKAATILRSAPPAYWVRIRRRPGTPPAGKRTRRLPLPAIVRDARRAFAGSPAAGHPADCSPGRPATRRPEPLRPLRTAPFGMGFEQRELNDIGRLDLAPWPRIELQPCQHEQVRAILFD